MLTIIAIMAGLGQPQPTGEATPFEWVGEPTLVAKGKGYLIHAVPFQEPFFQFRQIGPTTMIVFHTATETGKMTPLLATGTERSDRRNAVMFFGTSLVGITADTERLYALVFSGNFSETAGYFLKVYALGDGKLLHTLPVKEAALPVPPSTTKPGALQLIENGVACHGATFTFKGQDLVQQRAGQKPAPLAAVPPAALFALEWEEPRLLVKGNDCLIQSLSRKPREVFSSKLPTQGMFVFHTTVATGKMKVLAVTSTFVQTEFGFGMGSVISATKVVGLTADTERLYVLLSSEAQGKGPTYDLKVYARADGKLLHTLRIKEGDFPKELPAETTKPGPLTLKENRVACYGVTFTFKGTELLEQRYDKK